MTKAWPLWTVLEALSKTAAKLLQKTIGIASLGDVACRLSPGSSWVYRGKKRQQMLLGESGQVAGACMFGFLAFVATVCGFVAFLPRYGGDVGVFSFLVTLSIVPGSFFDRFWFGHEFKPRKWIGVTMAIFAGYRVLGWPTLAALGDLPAWVWLGVVTMLAVALNQVITQTIKDIDPFVKNFWGGLVTVGLSLIFIPLADLESLLATEPMVIWRLSWLSVVIGGIVVGMWCFNLVSYKKGASIALKKLAMNGTYLSTAMVSGVVFFHEPASWSKIIGVVVYILAFGLADDSTALYLRCLLKKEKLTPINP